MRRFDPNASGGIDYEEFLRFNLSDSNFRAANQVKLDPTIEQILMGIVYRERLTLLTVVSFCTSLKRMFAIIDKETTGVVPMSKFSYVLSQMGVELSDVSTHSISGWRESVQLTRKSDEN